MVSPAQPRSGFSVSQESLERCAAIARIAGAAILDFYEGDIEVTEKEDRSPVTAADHAAHQLILDNLRAWTPAIPVISEEGIIPAFADRRGWQRFWLVDPLDGTKEFVSKNGEFTVNIALIEHGCPELGVVYAPAFDRLYAAGTGLGAWKEADGRRPHQIFSTPPRNGDPVTVVESRSHPSAALEAYLATLDVTRRVQAGSSLKFCLVAEGKADLYPRLGPTMEWDVAAGDCVFRNSGKAGPRFSPLEYNKPDLRNASFVIGWDSDGGTTQPPEFG